MSFPRGAEKERGRARWESAWMGVRGKARAGAFKILRGCRWFAGF